MAIKAGLSHDNIKIETDNHPLPKKGGMVLCCILYFFSSALFFLAAFLKMPLFGEVIEFGSLRPVISVFQSLFPSFSSIPLTIMYFVTLVMYTKFVKNRYPTIYTLVSIVYNDIACTIFAIIYYSINLRQIYFTKPVVFIIPVLTIILSSVFILDDTIDLLKNKFEVSNKVKQKKKKRKKGELQMTEVPEFSIASIQEITEAHAKAAAKAAEMAIPSLKNETEEIKVEGNNNV